MQNVQIVKFNLLSCTNCASPYTVTGSIIIPPPSPSQTHRYSNTSVMPTEFTVDESVDTRWQSADNTSPVAFVVGLTETITLSKVLVTFHAPSPYQNAILQLFNAGLSQWMDVQYYAQNCESDFTMTANAM